MDATMTSSGNTRAIDCAVEASTNLVALNNTIVNMRSSVKAAKVHIIHKLTRMIKKLKAKKGTEEHKNKNLQKAQRLLDEIFTIKELNVDKVSKYSLESTKSFSDISRQPSVSTESRALARLSEHKCLAAKVNAFRTEHSDWKKLAAYLLTKQTGRRFRTKQQKQRAAKKGSKFLSNILKSTEQPILAVLEPDPSAKDCREKENKKTRRSEISNGGYESGHIGATDEDSDSHSSKNSTEKCGKNNNKINFSEIRPSVINSNSKVLKDSSDKKVNRLGVYKMQGNADSNSTEENANDSDSTEENANDSDSTEENANDSDGTEENANNSDSTEENANDSDSTEENANDIDGTEENADDSDNTEENANDSDDAGENGDDSDCMEENCGSGHNLEKGDTNMKSKLETNNDDDSSLEDESSDDVEGTTEDHSVAFKNAGDMNKSKSTKVVLKESDKSSSTKIRQKRSRDDDSDRSNLLTEAPSATNIIKDPFFVCDEDSPHSLSSHWICKDSIPNTARLGKNKGNSSEQRRCWDSDMWLRGDLGSQQIRGSHGRGLNKRGSGRFQLQSGKKNLLKGQGRSPKMHKEDWSHRSAASGTSRGRQQSGKHLQSNSKRSSTGYKKGEGGNNSVRRIGNSQRTRAGVHDHKDIRSQGPRRIGSAEKTNQKKATQPVVQQEVQSHPSWEAKRKQKQMEKTAAFSGKRIKFDD